MLIRVIYDPLLREVTKPVTVFDDQLKKTAEQMLKLMHRHIGIGLAANQIGLDQQLIVMEYKKEGPEDETPEIPKTVLCNPKVVKFSKETDVAIEGCLSLPGLELPVERSTAVVVEAQNLSSKKVTIKAKGLFARVLQHEIDHLNGILFTDHVKDIFPIKAYQFAQTAFFGSDDFSLEVLKQLVDGGVPVTAVVCESDKKAGRGQVEKTSPVKLYAQENGIADFSVSLASEIPELLKQIKPKLLVLASYGKILPQDALVIPDYGCLNVHPSMLPKYRGATPIQSVIAEGSGQTGVTIMQMVPGVDSGPIVAQQEVSINSEENYLQLKTRLAKVGAQLLLKTIPVYLSGQARITAQNEHEATLTKKLEKSDGEIDWNDSTENIVNKIRAYNPWPGTYTQLSGKRLKIISARNRAGKLEIIEIQLEGKNPTNWPDFCRGYQNQLTREPWYGKIYR